MNNEQKIMEKINNGSNDFSDVELTLVLRDNQLFKQLIKSIANEKIEINEKLMIFFVGDIINYSNIEKSELDKCINLVLKKYIDLEYYEDGILELYCNQFELDDKTKKELEDYYEASFKNKNNMFKNATLSNEFINKLLDYKRYDVISSLDKNRSYTKFITNYFDNNIYQRLVDEWPYDEIPHIIRDKQIFDNTYHFSKNDSLEDLIKWCADDTDNNEVFDALFDKVVELPSANFLTYNENFVNIVQDDDVYEKCRRYNKEKIAKILYDKDCLVLTRLLLETRVLNPQQVRDKIDYLVKNHMQISTDAIDAAHIYPLDNKELTKLLLDYGRLNFFLVLESYQKREGYDRVLEEYVDYIVKQIEEDNEYYNEYLTSISYLPLGKYPEIFRAIINKGKLKVITLNSGYNNDDIVEMFNKNPGVRANLSGVGTKSLNIIGEKLLNQKNYSTFISYIPISPEFIQNHEDIILEGLEEYSFANVFIKKYPNYLKNEKILRKCLTNKLLIDETLDVIIHNEDLSSLLNDEVFSLVKDYYVKEYNLNQDHLIKLENDLGPSIIRYMSNESLHSIINMDDETFNKIISLFPKVEFTMNDFEAGYESIIQYGYGKNNVEDITIFSSFRHAIEDKNDSYIRKYREKLIIYTKKEFLQEILKKHNIPNINGTDELLDLIISKYDTEEQEKYINILHELTNEYIANSRTHYHNNHFFEEKYDKYSNFFEKILQAIDSENEYDDEIYLAESREITLNRIIIELIVALSQNFNEYLEKYNISTNNIKNEKEFVYYIIENIRNQATRDKYLPILKEIVDNCYEKEKNKHLKELNIKEECKLPYILDEKSKRNEIIKYIICNSKKYVDKDDNNLYLVFLELLEKKGIDKRLADDCLNYYSGLKYYVNDFEVVKQNLGFVVETLTNYVRNNKIYEKGKEDINYDEIAKELDEDYKIKRIYSIPKTQDQYQILINLNLDLLNKNLFNDENKLKYFIDLLKKKKVHALPECLKGIIEKASLSDDYSNIAAFMNFFIPIVEAEKNKLSAVGKDTSALFSGLASILENADTYSSVSSIYSQILGEEDAKLIKKNPNPNSAVRKIKGTERLDEALSSTIENYQRTEITVPTFDMNVKVSNNKELNVILGNFTDPCTMTLGERTGACMRIGGVGDSLFDFCRKNKNGFHIVFKNPKTNDFISRVSGFRNGNTVFLNELRYSCRPLDYSDDDVLTACEFAAKQLIEMSKESSCPIDNVVISRQYAMIMSGYKETHLGIIDNKEGLARFYSDVGNSAIVLATSAENSKFVPINFDKKNVPTYSTCRAKPLVITDSNQLLGKINRVASIKTALSGVPFSDIDSMLFENGAICGVVSDDWYIYVDDDKKIHYDFIDIDPRAEKEMESYIELMDQIIEKAVEEKYGDEVSYGTK